MNKQENLEKDTWKYIGDCVVDSGQLMIMDPCYMKDHLEDKEFEDHRNYKDKNTGKCFEFRKDFTNFMDKPEGYDNLTFNDLIRDEVLIKDNSTNPNIAKNGERESYASISQGTIDNRVYPLRFTTGRLGLGVAFCSGYGDGMYPIYAKEYDGRIAEIKIIMIDDEDKE